jgi:hypothetical protein
VKLPTAFVVLLLAGCGSSTESFVPGVEGRSLSETCQTKSAECQEWTALAKKCEENMAKRDAGDMSPMKPYCSDMETLREQASGVALSTDPGAFNF